MGFAQENWIFNEPVSAPVNSYGTTNPLTTNYNNGISTDSAYTGKVDTTVYTNTYSNYNNSVYIPATYTPPTKYTQPATTYTNSQTTTYSKPVTTSTYNTSLKTKEAEPKKTL